MNWKSILPCLRTLKKNKNGSGKFFKGIADVDLMIKQEKKESVDNEGNSPDLSDAFWCTT